MPGAVTSAAAAAAAAAYEDVQCCCDDSNTIPANTSLGNFAACLLGLVSSCIHVS